MAAERVFQKMVCRNEEGDHAALDAAPVTQNRHGAAHNADWRIDRSKPYPSCAWLEHGLAFNRRSLHACLIVHHGRGLPHLCDFAGGKIDMQVVLAARRRIVRENQNGGHEACRGCPHLVTRRWLEPRFAVKLIGIAQFTHCNIACNYCYLQTQDPETYRDGATPYKVLPAIQQLIEENHLAPNAIVDWGGGEPTIYPEFDAVLALITRRGGTTWIHTNGTRVPKPIVDGLPTKSINILCSVDAGTAQVWKRIKRKDLFEVVWRNLEQFARLRCGVVLKYIVKQENCADSELRAFIDRAVRVGPREIVLDVDYDFPDPDQKIVHALRTLYRLSKRQGIRTVFGSTGALFTPEIDVSSRVIESKPYGIRYLGYKSMAKARAIVHALSRTIRRKLTSSRCLLSRRA